jgi:peptidoglycan/LPS O-acetylase OafA/YrhL
LFFCLSGFVLPLAYEERFRVSLSPLEFFRIRLIRLMPLVVLATISSAIYVLFRAYVNQGPISYGELLAATLLGALNLPFLDASKAIGGPQIFPLNGPQYSLFFEVVVNVVWSVARRYYPTWLSLIVFLGCTASLLFVGLGGDETITFWSGFPRVGASFFAGVLIYHLDRAYLRKVELQRAFWFFAFLLALSFYYPTPLPAAVNIAFIVVVSPLVVWTGSRVRLSGKCQSIATLSGALSYPVYVLHYPIFCWINGFYQFATKQPQNIYIEGPPLLAGILIGSYVLLKIFDEPTRYALSHGTWPTLRREVKKA